MPSQTYRDQFVKLVDKGYLVHQKGNYYAFYETPQKKQEKIETTAVSDSAKSNTPIVVQDASAVPKETSTVQSRTSEDIEINNTDNTNNKINNNGLVMKQVSSPPKKFKF